MNKFKKWLHEKEPHADFQGSIGYMIEYILLQGLVSYRRFGGWLQDEMKRRFSEIDNGNHIDIVFDILKEMVTSKIKEKK